MHDRQQVIQRWTQHGCESRNRRGSRDCHPPDSLLPLAVHPPSQAPAESTDRKGSTRGRHSAHRPRYKDIKADSRAHAAPRKRREECSPKTIVPTTSRHEILGSSIFAPRVRENVCSCIVTSWVRSISVLGLRVPLKSHFRSHTISTSYPTPSATASPMRDGCTDAGQRECIRGGDRSNKASESCIRAGWRRNEQSPEAYPPRIMIYYDTSIVYASRQ